MGKPFEKEKEKERRRRRINYSVDLNIMVVKFPVFTQSMADAIAVAKQQAAAQGFKSMYLVKVDKVGNGAWEVTMRVGS